MIAPAEVDVWPELRRYVLGRGGMAAGDWSRDLVPGGLYRRGGCAPDVVAGAEPSVWHGSSRACLRCPGPA